MSRGTRHPLCVALLALMIALPAFAGRGRTAGDSLFHAVRKNDLAAATASLRSQASVNARDPEGLTALMIASGLGSPQMVSLLLAAGADVHMLDSRMGATALHKAAQGGGVEVASLLLKRGAFIDVQSPTLGHTPLLDAVWHKRTKLVRFLLESGAKTTLKTHAGSVALDWARRDKLDEIVALLEAADRSRTASAAGQKLMEAVRKNDLEDVKKAIKDGADVNERTPMVGSPDDGHTPLLFAARGGSTDIVRELLAAKADPRIVDGLIKATPGHKAGYMGHADVARLLVNTRLELDAQGPYNGYTALHDAIWHGHTATAKVYLDAGARLDLAGHDGRTPLAMAREEGYPEIAKLIESRLNGSSKGAGNALRAFIYGWFDDFDRQVDVSVFLAALSASDLEMKFPERTLRSHADFVDWYAGIRKTIRVNAHELSDITVAPAGAGEWSVSLKVRWTATTTDGKPLEAHVRQAWTVAQEPGGRFVIHRYTVQI